MSTNLSKTLMVLLLCLTFIGQAMASAVMPFHMMDMAGMNMEQDQSHDMSNMDHSAHAMLDDSSMSESESTDDCCASSCQCYASGCTSVALFNEDNNHSFAIAYATKIASVNHLAQSQQLTSLYRPPILS